MIMISGDLLLLFYKCVNLLTSYKLTHSDSSQREGAAAEAPAPSPTTSMRRHAG